MVQSVNHQASTPKLKKISIHTVYHGCLSEINGIFILFKIHGVSFAAYVTYRSPIKTI